MPEPAISADLLQDILDGRTFANASSPEADLAMLARACRTVRVPGPNTQTEARLALKIRSMVRLDEPEARTWWQGWVGGTSPRPLVHKLAAAVMVAGLAGGGTSAATGVSPAEFAQESASLIRSIIVNLNPGDSGSPSPLVSPSPTPSATSSPESTTTPPPGGTPPPTAAGSPPTTQAGNPTSRGGPASTAVPPTATLGAPLATQTPPSPGTPAASVTGGPVASPSASSTPEDGDDNSDDDDDDGNSGNSGNSGSGSGSGSSDDSPEEEDD